MTEHSLVLINDYRENYRIKVLRQSVSEKPTLFVPDSSGGTGNGDPGIFFPSSTATEEATYIPKKGEVLTEEA